MSSKAMAGPFSTMPRTPLLAPTDGPTNALFLSPDREPVPGRDCTTMVGHEDMTMHDVLLVELIDTPGSRLSTWMEGTNGTHVRELTLVGVDGFANDSKAPLDAASSLSLESINDPGDITGLGITVSEYLSDRRDATPTTVCLHSLTTLLQYATLETVFQFTHTLSGHLSRSNALAHCHLDPSAVDEQVVNALRPLFDVVIDVDDGDPHVVTTPTPTA